MREAYSAQQKSKVQQQSTQQSSQPSHRSGQGQHQKTNSMSIKGTQNVHQQMLSYEDPIQLKAALNQPSLQQPQINQVMNKGSQGSTGHKKSNSLMNSKMAQILLKGTPGGLIINNNGGLWSQIPSSNQTTHQSFNQQNQQQQPYIASQQQQLYSNPPSYTIQNASQLISSNYPAGIAQTISNQTSFLNPSELASQSIEYSKPSYFLEEYEGIVGPEAINSFHQRKVISQIPSNKQLMQNLPQKQEILQQDAIGSSIFNETDGIKKQQATVIIKGDGMKQIQGSAMKQSKKATNQSNNNGPIHHQRTKSDNIYNRGSLIQNPISLQAPANNQVQSQNKTQAHVTQFQKQQKVYGQANNVALKNNFIEPSLAIQQQQQPNRVIHHQKNASTGFVIFNQPIQGIQQSATGQQQRKPGSASHSKKPSQTSNINVLPAPSQPSGKKTTREKYLELKGLYNDLLERHYAQQQQFQNQQQITQQPSNQNLIDYPGMQQLQQQQYMIQQQLDALNNLNSQNTSTPRIGISNQISSATLNSQNYQPHSQHEIVMKGLSLQQQIQKSLKLNISGKEEVSMTLDHTQNNPSTSLLKQQKIELQPKTAIKLNIGQGVSRKVASGANHKRSASDGNEQLFKFKQAAMQRYLYPQPSNQVGLATLNSKAEPQDLNLKTKEEFELMHQQHQLGSSGEISHLQPSHQRRVSDDFYQKQKKSQLHLQQQLAGIQPNYLAQQKKSMQFQYNNLIENVPSEQPNEYQKPQTVDFNIKGFLIEMRNQQEKGSNGGNSLINIMENDNKKGKVQLSPQEKHSKKEFAMIIEENTPTGIGGKPQNTIGSQRKLSAGENQYKLTNNNPTQKSSDFSKIIQKQKNLLINDGFENQQNDHDQNPKSAKQVSSKAQQPTHKRVKSDVNQEQIKKPNALCIPSTIIHNLNKGSGLLNKKSSQQTSGSNIFSSDKNTPKKPGINFAKQKYPAGNIQFSQSHQLDGAASKKIINVSIDLIKEAEMDVSSIGDDLNKEGRWIEVDNNNSASDLGSEKNKIKFKTKKQNFIAVNDMQQQFIMSGGNEPPNRQEKYKKIASKYEIDVSQNKKRKNVNDTEKSHPVSPIQSLSPKNRLSNVHQNKPIHQDQTNQNSDVQVQQIRKSAIGTKIQSPKHFKKDQIKPSAQLAGTQIQVKKANLQSNYSKQQLQLQQPLNQIKAAPPNNSVVQTQESARNSLITTQQNVNLNFNGFSAERVDTQDSTVSDQNLSPRTRYMTKLIKHIKLSFKQTNMPPQTTVDFYRIGKVLGKGAFGKVNLALHKLTQKFAAVKSINKQYLSEEAQTKKVMQEVVILKKTRHRNIVRLYEFFETQKHILFVIELCAGGDLLNYVRKRRRLKEDVAKHIFRQIIEGLGYCHSKNIVHRDIKLDNILLDSEGEVKICDFGVSKLVKKGEKMSEQCGTPAYIAPEILRDKGYTGFAVDIWSAGVVLYAMLYGTVPFKANNMSELQKLIMKAKYTLKDDISEESRDLLVKLLEIDPEKRISIQEILLHKWLLDSDNSIQLFTEQEKEYIKSEFTYNDTDRYNRNETDPFAEHMLDSAQDSMFKNCTSKSVVLAPFNSTKSHIEQNQSLSETIKEMLQSKRCIKFAARVRDIDKQYEINNNAELDNGVYHKFDEEDKEEAKKEGSEDSLQSSFNKESSLKSNDEDEELRLKDKQSKKDKKKKKKEKQKQTEMEKLESMINQEEEDQGEEQHQENPYVEGDIMIKDQLQEQIHKMPQEASKRSPRPQTNGSQLKASGGVIGSAATLIIDERIVSVIEQFGYPRKYIEKSLNMNELNYSTTSYYLLQNEHAMSAGGNKESQLIKNLVSL